MGSAPTSRSSTWTSTGSRHMDDLFGDRVVTLFSNSFDVGRVVERADLLIGAMLVTGARAPILVTRRSSSA